MSSLFAAALVRGGVINAMQPASRKALKSAEKSVELQRKPDEPKKENNE